MTTAVQNIRCLLVPLRKTTLLVPSVVVAEITAFATPAKRAQLPAWCLGSVSWRNLNIPVIDFESTDEKVTAVLASGRRKHLAIFHGLNRFHGLEYYGIITIGIPKSFRATVQMRVEKDGIPRRFGRLSVNTGRERAIIPDLDLIESHLAGLKWASPQAADENPLN